MIKYKKLLLALPILSTTLISTSSFANLTSGTVLTIINNLQMKGDVHGIGASAVPITIKVYAAAGTATAPCDTSVGLSNGGSFTTTVGATGKCTTAINHFTVTPLSSTSNGRFFPYGSNVVDTTPSATTGTVLYSVNDTGAGTAGTAGTLTNGIYAPCTGSAAAGSGDTSIPPALDTNGLLQCEGAPTITLLPTLN